MIGIPAPATDPEPSAAFVAAPVASTRSDGWTGEKQRLFLEAVADGATVTEACADAKMSVASAYALRRRAGGQALALGWSAANLLARDRVADRLLARAHEGQESVITAADGSTRTRRYHDNGLALRLLARLDRYADASEPTAPGQAARLIAAEFDQYLSTVESGGGPARAGLFLSAREGAGDLEPIAALARADRMLRGGAGLASEVNTADLDPAARAGWSAEQWARAEAAGLIRLAPPPAEPGPKPAIEPQLPQLDEEPDEPQDPVWWCDIADDWRTSFPPPPDFPGREEGRYGDEDYARTLTPDEWALADGMDDLRHEATVADRRVEETAARDRCFVEWKRELTEAGYKSMLDEKPVYAPPPATGCRRCAKVDRAEDGVLPGEGAALH